MLVGISTIIYSTIFETGNAYLDPGSGSFILQLILASLMGALFMLGMYWKKVKVYFKNLFKKKDERMD